MPSRTNLKIAEQIRQRAAHVILFELKDPRMGFVTITHVKLAPDLTTCTIFWSVLGGPAERSKTAHALEHARLFVQRRVAEGLKTRNAPQLSFEYDESVEGAIKMGDLLKKLRAERGEPDPDQPAAAGEPGATAATEAAVDADADSDADSEVEEEEEDEESEAEEEAEAELDDEVDDEAESEEPEGDDAAESEEPPRR